MPENPYQPPKEVEVSVGERVWRVLDLVFFAFIVVGVVAAVSWLLRFVGCLDGRT